MNYYYDVIKRASGYIEDNLSIEIKVRDIAEAAGFSQFHFMRIFRALSSHTINNYIKRRVMTQAGRMLLETDMRIIDIAVLYGYKSQEAFTRAFKEVYNITPNAYRKNKVAYKNIEQIVLNENVFDMKASAITPIEPEIIYREDFFIAGMLYSGRNDNFEIPKLWNEFRSKIPSISNRLHRDACYGYESYNEDFEKAGFFEYLAGFEIADPVQLPEGMSVKKVNKSRYAVFTINAVVENVPKSIGEIYSFHLPGSGLKVIGNYDFEYYDSSFEVNNENSCIYFYIPVE